MGIALFGLDGLLTRLRSLAQWLLRPRQASPRAAHVEPAVAPAASGTGRAIGASVRPPLRVVRVVEGSRAVAGAGRMFMSGRMADVCAELERLAALEAAAG